MGDETGIGLLKWIDGAAKLVTALGIPVIGVIVDNHLKAQTAALEHQKEIFQEAMSTRQRNIDLSLKFYEVIGSKRFECYDESKGPLLKIFLDTNNKYNDVKIPYEDVAGSLIKTTIGDPGCSRVAEDTLAAKESNHGEIPVVVASDVPEAQQKNEQVKNTIAAVAKKLQKDGRSDGDASLGWVALGRRHEVKAALDYSNFVVVGVHSSDKVTLQANMVIKSKTAVYLRHSADDTGLGRNHILAVLSRGTCVAVKRVIPELRSQVWAQVEVGVACPEDDSSKRAGLPRGDG